MHVFCLKLKNPANNKVKRNLLALSTLQIKTDTFTNSVAQDVMACHKLSHYYLLAVLFLVFFLFFFLFYWHPLFQDWMHLN